MESRGDSGSGYGHMRASSADRERAIDVLKAGFAEGRLTREELEDREARALRARTYDELGQLTSDLPAGPLGGLAPAVSGLPAVAPVPGYPQVMASRTNRLAIASLITAFIPFWGTLASLICGHVARKQIRERGEGGATLAMTGLVISYATVLLFAVAVIAHMVSAA
jgi:Domain of unknown function (DUF1707)/Domain of unknown function (DUF4190)